jgi:hypothetical protein
MKTINGVTMSDAAATNLAARGMGEQEVASDLIRVRSGMRRERLEAGYCGAVHVRPQEVKGWKDYVAALVQAVAAE